jgi:hypothetical protein
MTKVIPFKAVTKASIMREGKRELLRIYQMSAGGSDPVVDGKAWEEFEMGILDEMPWKMFCDISYQMFMMEEE